MHQATASPAAGPARLARPRPGLYIAPYDWPLILAGVEVQPRYRILDPDTGELVPRCARIRRVPAVSGSTRVLSVGRLDRTARRVARQVRAAVRHGRAVEWLAAVMLGLDRLRPPGARRADARHHIALVAAAAAAVCDFPTGRHSMPGLQDTAAQTGLSERTVSRHWAVLVTLDALHLDQPGRWLLAGERAAIQADPDQRTRWRDRAEWTLLIPGWVREVTDAELAPWLARARAVLAMIADPDAPAGQDQLPPLPDSGSVYPPSRRDLVWYLPLRRTKFSMQAAVGARRRRRPSRPGGRAEVGAASRPSTTGQVPQVGRRPMPPQAVALAREVAADGRIQWLAGARRDRLAATLRRLAERGWTADDVHEQVELTLRERDWTLPQWVIAPLAYLALLLRDVDPDRPPATMRRAAAAAQSREQAERQAERRREGELRAERQVPGRDHPLLQRVLAQIGLRPPVTSPASAPSWSAPTPPLPRPPRAPRQARPSRPQPPRPRPT